MDYRAYALDDEGHIIAVHEFDCSSDEEAKQTVARMLDGHDLEVWQLNRRIAVLRRHTRH